MDRVRSLAPTLLAALALLGQQGARFGPFIVPDIRFRWVLLVVAAIFLLTPKREGRRLGARDAMLATALALTFAVLALVRAAALDPPLALTVTMDGERTVIAESLQIAARRDLRRLSGRRRHLTLLTEAVLEVPRDGDFRFDVDCDDGCNFAIGDARFREQATLELERGELPFSLVYRQLGGPARLRFGWNTPAAVELLPMEYFLRARSAGSRKPQRLRIHATLVLLTLWFWAVATWLARIAPYRVQIFERRWVPVTAATVIILYGSLLRFDALLVHSGQDAHVHLRHWVPSYGVFNPANAPEDPYRADVRSYLERAETFSLSSFYAPSFREPFYIALSVPFLKLAGGEIGILIQSFFFSLAALVLFFFVANRLHGIWWATGLLVPVALHEWLILEAPSGYRMSAYVFFLLAAVAAMFLSPIGRRGAVGTGVLSGLLCLIRLSALSVFVPLLALRLWPLPRRERIRYGGLVVVLLVVLVGPFLVSNAVTYGDPFYAVSFHTQFWMRAEGLDATEGPVSFSRYFTEFGRAGALVKGTFLGLTALPVKTFWRGLHLFPFLNAITLGLGALGLLLSTRTEHRFLPAAYFFHLVPFAYIQNFPSGEMPRFVMPAYFFLVLAIPEAVHAVIRPRTRRAPSEG